MAALTQKKTCSQMMEEWKEFMWNPRTREFMGRTGSSWALILLFYVVFYAFLTAVFSLSLWVMLQTIDEYTPKYADRLANPGLMIRPKMDTTEVVYSTNGMNGTWQAYVDNLNSLLKDYNKTVQMERGVNCTPGVYNMQEDTGDVRNNPKKACWFFRDVLGDCSGVSDTTYGYQDGKPCVLIKMNRVINFLPVPIKELSNTSITIKCTAQNNDDLLGSIQYFPSVNNQSLGAIDLMYFPYYGNRAQQNYTQPFVAVKFLNATKGVDHMVECRVNAANINNQDPRDLYQGRVIFTMKIDRL
uniref:Sodium/potassium-transporting ATPase subunit beta-2 n=1 Tax=Rhinella marina TaxID=8386 RepID=AT1B2_RHIMB|nr:RecName: Full=Sodium/potassium-transporting ATPase subunit beta-2; AltName: Full=Beta-B1 chain; AltName: Full=Sodium/potassium-dependent ATPase beta-2 subunit [Rhinella marina]CAA81060.1 beta subunit of a P-ATPase [Rhinella marina]prf//2010414A P ATPase:SUBUNIT=beta [Rhinella marina]